MVEPTEQNEREGINIVLSGIDKLSSGDYIITGKRLGGYPPITMSPSDIMTGQLAIKYDTNGNIITQTDFMMNANGASVVDYKSERSKGSYMEWSDGESRWKLHNIWWRKFTNRYGFWSMESGI